MVSKEFFKSVSGGFTKIPKSIFSYGLKPGAIGFYITLASHAANFQFNYKYILSHFPISESSCKTFVKKLKLSGLLTITRRDRSYYSVWDLKRFYDNDFFIIHNTVIRKGCVSMEALGLYAYLCSVSSFDNITQEKLSVALSCDITVIKHCIDELIDHHLLVTAYKQRDLHGGFSNNKYFLFNDFDSNSEVIGDSFDFNAPHLCPGSSLEASSNEDTNFSSCVDSALDDYTSSNDSFLPDNYSSGSDEDGRANNGTPIFTLHNKSTYNKKTTAEGNSVYTYVYTSISKYILLLNRIRVLYSDFDCKQCREIISVVDFLVAHPDYSLTVRRKNDSRCYLATLILDLLNNFTDNELLGLLSLPGASSSVISYWVYVFTNPYFLNTYSFKTSMLLVNVSEYVSNRCSMSGVEGFTGRNFFSSSYWNREFLKKNASCC